VKHLVFAALLISVAGPAAARDPQAMPPPETKIRSCLDDPGYHELDFWIGRWNVQVKGVVIGKNRIERILRGCAVMEHWEARRGDKGKSLFTYDRLKDVWKQVWVSDGAFSPGGLKEKVLVERLEGGGLRFQGEIALANGGSYLDRTTLRPLNNGTVHQLIEISHDNGFSWTATFDAVYTRAP
jgi:hypothetical protein